MIYPQTATDRVIVDLYRENKRLQALNADTLAALKKLYAHLDAFDEERIARFAPKLMGEELFLLIGEKTELQALITEAEQGGAP